MERIGWKVFSNVITRRSLVDKFGGKTKNWFLRNFFRKNWGKHRDLPVVAEKSFSKQWKERNQENI